MKTIRRGYAPVSGGKLYFEIEGDGDPVVFVHGFTLDHRMWDAQVEFLSRRYKVITYDARGFGQSSLPTGPYSHTEDLKSLLDHLDIDWVHLVGLSMGGRIAINFTLEHPSAVRTLALLDSALDDYPDPTDWNVHAKTGGLDQAKRNWLAHDLFAGTRRNKRAVKALGPIVEDYSGWHWLNDDPQFPMSSGAAGRLGEIHVPTLVVVGELDLNYFHGIAKSLASGIADASLVVVPKAGHMVNMEAPDTCNKLLLAHLEGQRPTA